MSVPARPGYTLAEVLLVLTLLGLLLVLAAPVLDTVGYRMNNAVHEVGGELAAAQRLAVVRGHDIVVAFDTSRRAVRIHDDRDNDRRVGPGEPLRWVALPAGVRFGRGAAPPHPWLGPEAVGWTKRQDGLPAVVFHRSGSASAMGGFYLVSERGARERRPQDARAVVIDRATGRVSVWRFTGSRWEVEL